MVESPEDESKTGAVPESGKEEYDYQIQVGSVFTFFVTAQRDIEILPEPGSQRDMPPAPELGNGRGHVGISEVLQEFESEHLAETDSHIRISREIVINLKSVKDRSNPYYLCGHGVGIICIDPVCRFRNSIGNDNLFAEAKDETSDSFSRFFYSDSSVFQLVVDVLISDNGTCNELWEEGNVECKVYDLLLNRELSSVEIDDVRHYLEGEKRNTDGKSYAYRCYGNVEVINQNHGSEGSVFEKSQKSQIKDDIQDQDQLRFAFELIKCKTGEVIHDDRCEHQKNVNRLPPGIEEQAGKEQKYINIFVFAKYSAADKNDGQEYHDKYQRTEKHISPNFKVQRDPDNCVYNLYIIHQRGLFRTAPDLRKLLRQDQFNYLKSPEKNRM